MIVMNLQQKKQILFIALDITGLSKSMVLQHRCSDAQIVLNNMFLYLKKGIHYPVALTAALFMTTEESFCAIHF